MKKHPPLGLSLPRSILLIAIPVAACACSKKASKPSPALASTAPSPAAVADKGGRPSPGDDTIPAGIDLHKLDATQRKAFDQVVSREPSACGKGHSLLHSVRNDRDCRASFYAVRYVARLAGSGSSDSEISEKLQQRFHAPRVPYIDVSQAPSKGSPSGRVKLVEFSDYECSHCKEAQPLIHKLVAEYPNDITIYFKHFPLSGHMGSLNGALGAAAAQNQGKFWQYNEKVWESSDNLRPAVLESLARDVGLDFPRWYADVGTEEVRSHVQRDKAEGSSLEIRRTPAIFINARRFTDEIDLASLKDWIDEELGR